jgi:hypothetical protein
MANKTRRTNASKASNPVKPGQIGVSLLAGLGIGAVAMYLFDTELGQQRRQQLGSNAHDMLARARELAEEQGKRLPDVDIDQVVETARRTGGRLVEQGRQWVEQGMEHMPQLRSHPKSHPVAKSALTGTGLLALGGVVFFLDPWKGAERRARVMGCMQKAVSETGKVCRLVGQKIAGSGDRFWGEESSMPAGPERSLPEDAPEMAASGG